MLTSIGSEFIANLAKSNARFCLRLHYNGIRVICMLVKHRFRFVKSKDLIIYELYVLFRNCLKKLLKSEMKESLWNEVVYDSSVD